MNLNDVQTFLWVQLMFKDVDPLGEEIPKRGHISEMRLIEGGCGLRVSFAWCARHDKAANRWFWTTDTGFTVPLMDANWQRFETMLYCVINQVIAGERQSVTFLAPDSKKILDPDNVAFPQL